MHEGKYLTSPRKITRKSEFLERSPPLHLPCALSLVLVPQVSMACGEVSRLREALKEGPKDSDAVRESVPQPLHEIGVCHEKYGSQMSVENVMEPVEEYW